MSLVIGVENQIPAWLDMVVAIFSSDLIERLHDPASLSAKGPVLAHVGFARSVGLKLMFLDPDISVDILSQRSQQAGQGGLAPPLHTL